MQAHMLVLRLEGVDGGKLEARDVEAGQGDERLDNVKRGISSPLDIN